LCWGEKRRKEEKNKKKRKEKKKEEKKKRRKNGKKVRRHRIRPAGSHTQPLRHTLKATYVISSYGVSVGWLLAKILQRSGQSCQERAGVSQCVDPAIIAVARRCALFASWCVRSIADLSPRRQVCVRHRQQPEKEISIGRYVSRWIISNMCSDATGPVRVVWIAHMHALHGCACIGCKNMFASSADL